MTRVLGRHPNASVERCESFCFPDFPALRAAAGHFWTVGPSLAALGKAGGGAGCKPFQTSLHDPAMGEVRLTGHLQATPNADLLTLLIHGFGGNADAHYLFPMMNAAVRTGSACLRLSLRGADLSGDDIYHGGITDDIGAALRSPALAKYKRVALIGYSVGGNIALASAIERIDPRICSVTAICPPVDLVSGGEAFDRPGKRLYRKYVFANLNRVYAATAKRRPLPSAIEAVRRARSVPERDELTVVPRFGFRSARDYYDRIGIVNRIDKLNIPALLVASVNDPVAPWPTMQETIGRASRALTVRAVDAGGHLFFPVGLDLNFGGKPGLENQIMRWTMRN